MTKKEYMQPVTNVVKIQQRVSILSASDGMNKSLQDEEVDKAWSRGGSIWDNN